MSTKLLVFLLIPVFFMELSYGQEWEWQPQQCSGINSNFVVASIAAVDENVVWAVLDTAVDESPAPNFTPKFLRTTNGGTTWKTGTVTGVKNTVILDICAIDSNTAWVATNDMAGSGGIYKTTDGGASWTQQASMNCGRIHFFDANNGVEILQTNIYTTNDGGTTWTRVPSSNIPAMLAGEFCIMYSGNNSCARLGDAIWFGTTKGRVYRSLDRGHSWEVFNTSLGEFDVINSIAFKDESNGLAGCALNSINFNPKNMVTKTYNKGRTWTTLSAWTQVTPACIAYMPGTSGTYVVVSPADNGESPGTSITNDNGATWTKIDNNQYNAVAFVAPNVGWAGGFTTENHGGMYKWTESTAVTDQNIAENVPQEYHLNQNYPNPFNPTTTIEFSIPRAGFVTLKIYNVVGEEVTTLVSEELSSGSYKYDWNATGHESGVYFYKIEDSNFVMTKKCLLIK